MRARRHGDRDWQVRAEIRAETCFETRFEMRSEVRSEVRTEALSIMKKARPHSPLLDERLVMAGLRLLDTYAGLAARGEHLFGRLLGGQSPRQWTHYPDGDAIDPVSGYQWFYHSHSPGDRPGAVEHGHLHLFARKPLWGRRLRSTSERAFAALCGDPSAQPATRHLLAIGFDAKGLPISLMTLNSWVTGDLMLGADLSLALLSSLTLHTGHDEVDAVIECVARLCLAELAELMRRRDDTLRSHPSPDKLHDDALELLSEIPIDLDARLAVLMPRLPPGRKAPQRMGVPD